MRIYKSGRTVAGMVVGGIFIVVAIAAGIHVVKQMVFESTDDAYVDGRTHTVAAKVPGRVEKVYVVDNQPVKKGDRLVDIESADFEVKLKEAKGALTAQEARVAEVKTRVAAAQAALLVQTAVFKQAKLDEARAKRLFAQGVLSQEKLEKAVTGLDLAQAQVKAAEEGLSQAKALVILESAQIDIRQASFESAQLNEGYTHVVAPSDGWVTKKSVEEGNMIQPGQPLMAVVALDDLWVTANFKETQLTHMHAGQGVELRVDAFPGRVYKGKIQSIMAGTGAAFTLFPPENALGNYVKVVQRIPVKITLDADKNHDLRIGMSVVARINVREE